MKNSKSVNLETNVSPLMLALVVLFVSCLVISNVLANQMLQVWKWSLDAGTLLFPITYVLSDVFSEVYGYKWSRRITWWAAGMNLLFAGLVFISNALPHPVWYDATHFQLALGSSFRIVVASIVSYVVGDFVNDKVFSRMKRNKVTMDGFKTRAFISSLCGQIVDSTLFTVIAFLFDIPAGEILSMILLNVCAKTAYEIVVLPLTYKVAKAVSDQENKFRAEDTV